MNVLQTWIGLHCTFRQQGVIILALRGPDGVPKEDAAKPIIRSFRGVVMNSGRHRGPMPLGMKMEGDPFMRTDLIVDRVLWEEVCKAFYDSIDQYNIHFIQHLLHATAVIGFKHPLQVVRNGFSAFYYTGVDALHMNPETMEQVDRRLRDGRRDGEGEDVFVVGNSWSLNPAIKGVSEHGDQV